MRVLIYSVLVFVLLGVGICQEVWTTDEAMTATDAERTTGQVSTTTPRPPPQYSFTMEQYMEYIRLYRLRVEVLKYEKVIRFVLLGLAYVLNTCVVIVFAQKKRRKQSVSLVLMALAVADCLALTLTMDNSIYIQHNNSPKTMADAACKIIFYVTQVGRDTSIYFVLLFTLERFISVRFPLKRVTICTRRRMAIGVAAVTITFALLESYVFFYVGTSMQNNRMICGPIPVTGTEERRNYGLLRLVIQNVIGFMVPCLTIAILNFLLIKSLREWGAKRAELSSNPDKGKSEADNRALTVMLVTVSTFSLVTILPYSLASFIGNNFPPAIPENMRLVLSIGILDMFYITNYSCNFFFYVFSGAQFRNEFLAIITCGKVRRGQKPMTTMTKTTGVYSNSEVSSTATRDTSEAIDMKPAGTTTANGEKTGNHI